MGLDEGLEGGGEVPPRARGPTAAGAIVQFGRVLPEVVKLEPRRTLHPRVGLPHLGGGLGDRRVGNQRALDLGGAEAVAGDVENVINAPGDPEVAGLVAACAVAGGQLHGRAAAELFQQGGHDVVLMDVHMPRMDGYATLHEMRELDPTVRVLLVTGNVQDLERFENTVGVPLLTKPYRAQELQALLSEIMMTERRAG